MFVSFIDNHRPSGLRLTVHRIDSTFLYYSTYDSFCNTFLKKFLREALAHIGDLRYNTFRGGIAQLGERLHGMQEVRGSIPLVSTISTFTDAREILHPFFLAINILSLCGRIFIARKNASLCDAYLSDGAPGGIRTLDPRLRRPLLYPTELQVQWSG